MANIHKNRLIFHNETTHEREWTNISLRENEFGFSETKLTKVLKCYIGKIKLVANYKVTNVVAWLCEYWNFKSSRWIRGFPLIKFIFVFRQKLVQN